MEPFNYTIKRLNNDKCHLVGAVHKLKDIKEKNKKKT